jgi:hypothetical protein
MNFPTFDQFQAKLLSEVVNMRNTKGKEYANSEDRFANFRRLADQLGLKDYQVAWIYGVKHLDSISSYIRTGRTFSEEEIRGRFVDAITYLTLIAGMIQEEASRPSLPDANVGKHQPFEYDPTPEANRG